MKRVLTVILFLVLALGVINTKALKSDIVIFIDPGHGGYDGGAYIDSIKEKDITSALASHLGFFLENAGYKVLYTRNKDDDLSESPYSKKSDIFNRVKLINESDCSFYISLHVNMFTQEKYRGAQVFFSDRHPLNESIAKDIQESLIEGLQNTNRVYKKIEGIYILDNVNKPGCLVEAGFLSNEIERKLLLDDGYLNLVSYYIYFGILNFINRL